MDRDAYQVFLESRVPSRDDMHASWSLMPFWETLPDSEPFFQEKRRTADVVAVKLQPKLWERCKREAVRKLGGKHSARAMQEAVRLYKQRCGSRCYAGRRSSGISLRRWTAQRWRTSSGKKSEGKRRYLPDEAWKHLSSSEKRRTNEAKRRGKGQWVKQPRDIARKTSRYRREK